MHGASASQTTSELLTKTVNKLSGDYVEAGELVEEFQRRSYGGVLLVLALLAMVPGISVFAGAAMVVPAFQLFFGLPAPVFPKSISRRKVNVSALRRWSPKVIFWVAKLERLVKPRKPLLTTPIARRVIGLMIVALGIIITIPFPFSNFPPALAIIFFALGLLERDGIMVAIGSVISAVACAIGVVVFYIVFEWLSKLFGY